MIKGDDLIGRPVIIHNTTETIAQVIDLLFDHTTNQTVAFMVNKGGRRQATQVLPWGGIHAVNADAVVTRSHKMIVRADQIFEIKRIMERERLAKGIRIMTTNGRDLGTVTDFYFGVRTGAIQGYEVRGGLFADGDDGISFVPAVKLLQVKDGVATVSAQTINMLSEHTGHTDKEGVARLLGRRVHRAVRNEAGLYIAAPGQIITNRVIEGARALGKERELWEAVEIQSTG